MKKTFYILLFAALSVSFNTSAQTYEEFINKAMDYQEAHDYAAAEQALKEAMRKEPANPGNTLLLSNLGTIQRHLGKLEDALISYSAALGKHPNAIFVLQNRAALYCEIDSINRALQDYNTILLMDENNAEALYRRGLISLGNKDYLSAEVDFEKIKVNEPDNIFASMGIALLMKRRGEWEKAENLYTDLIYKNKTNADLYLNRAECYLEMKKLARAQEDLNKSSSYGSENNPVLYVLRGQLKLQQYDKAAAKNDFMKARELGANSSLIDDMLRLCK